jgi:hypothetical protein
MVWRIDIDSFTFRPADHEGICVVHRRAFETLVGAPLTAVACEEYFSSNLDAFQAAAAAKITRVALTPGAAFHLTSRDIKRYLASSVPEARSTRRNPM